MDNLQNGITAFKSGKREEARKLFIAAMKENPNDENAWGWLYQVSNNDTEKIQALKKVFAINPQNARAKELLDKLTASISSKVETPPLSEPPSKNNMVAEQKKIATPPMQQKNLQIGIVAVFFICIICVFGAMAMGGGEKEKDYKTTAYAYCHVYLQDLLKSPSSADFPATSQADIIELENKTFEIRSYVDAQNSFGATLRKYYYCKIQYIGTEQDDETQSQFWKLINIQLFE